MKRSYRNRAFNALTLTAFCLLTLGSPQYAAAKEMKPEYNVGGYLKLNKTPPYEFKAAAAPAELPISAEMLPADIKSAAEKYLKDFPATTALMLIEDGKILFEAYQGLGRETSEFFSMSMAKSLSSMTIGKALCNGKIPSLDTTAAAINLAFGNGHYGRSTVKQLLMMSSGAYSPQLAGQPGFNYGIGRSPVSSKPYTGASWPLRLGQVSISELLWGKWWDQITHKDTGAPGESFAYKSGDSLSLSKVMEGATGNSLAAYFDQHIWQEIGAEGIAHWETDKEGTTINSSGFQARLRDWARIAIWTEKRFHEEDCFGQYMKEATGPQIPVKTGSPFLHYGYQWWVDNQYTPGFWALGYAGQMMAIHPPTSRILLKFSYRTETRSGGDIFRMFKHWTKG